MTEYINKLRNKLINLLLTEDKVVLDSKEYVELNVRATKPKGAVVEPLSREQLTMKQLGSYVPSFTPLAEKSDDFKQSLALLCNQLSKSTEFQYLIDHLKQDQVNLYLFDEEKKTDDWVRGSINGIYVVDEQIRLLGSGYKPAEKKPESTS